jgi:hypothetical protein
MDISPQKETWSKFKKVTFYTSIFIILVLILMVIFLL